MSENIKSGIAIQMEDMNRIQKEINELWSIINNNDKYFFNNSSEVTLYPYQDDDNTLHGNSLQFISWDDEIDAAVPKKIDLNDLLKEKEEPKKNYCYPHLWTEYVGLNEKFYFCKYCDERRKD